MSSKTVILVAGPTAVGKSDTAIFIAEKLGTEIISADSRQCFKEMSIGTAVPSSDDLARVKHHFIQSHSIHGEMSAGIYSRYAMPILKDVTQRFNNAVICGGTGLYIQALLQGLDDIPAVDKSIVDIVQDGYNNGGIEYLVNALKRYDPVYAQEGVMDNPSRMMRALSFVMQHNTSILAYRHQQAIPYDGPIIKIGLEIDRAILYERINNRVDKMILAGLMDELESLYPFRHLKNLMTVGYQEFYSWGHWPLSQEEIELSIDKVKQNSRRYAKRQMTWFKNREDLTWFHPEDLDSIMDFIIRKLDENS